MLQFERYNRILNESSAKADAICFVRCAIQSALNQTNGPDPTATSFHINFLAAKFPIVDIFSELNLLANHHLEEKVRKEILSKKDDSFLKTIYNAWHSYDESITRIRIYLHVPDFIYKRATQCGVRDLCFNLFLKKVLGYQKIRKDFIETLTYLAMQERVEDDNRDIQEICKMLIKIGRGCRSHYEEYFERPFLEKRRKFYRELSKKFLSEKTLFKFIRTLKQLIDEEKKRATYYVDELIESKLLKIVTEELIKDQISNILHFEEMSKLEDILKNKATNELACMYQSYEDFDPWTQMVVMCISHYLRKEGKELVMGENSTNPIVFIQNLLDLKDRFDHFLINALNNNELLKEMIKADIKNLLNLNPNSSKYISLFIDYKLREGFKGLSEQEIDTAMDKIIIIFRFVDSKVIFQRSYKHHLSRRLLLNTSVLCDNEHNMILRLKTECGQEFTKDLEVMIKDMSVSSTIMEEFRKHIASLGDNLNGIKLSVQVLTPENWPIDSTDVKGIIPQTLLEAFTVFERFYFKERQHRTLTLYPKLGSADLIALFYGDQNEEAKREDDQSLSPSSKNDTVVSGSKLQPRQHIISVSTYQMCILLLFNNRDEVTYEEILHTDIPEEDLKLVLQSMITGRDSSHILTKSPEGKEIGQFDTFTVNDSFTSKHYKVNIKTFSTIAECEAKCDENLSKMEESHKYQIDAVIVRIMKAKRRISHSSLLEECREELRSRFIPSPAVIERQIEGLIVQGYLARTTEDRKVYTYIP